MGYGLTYQIKYPVTSLNSRDNGKIVVCNIADTTTFAINAEEYTYDLGYSVNGKLNYPESPIQITTVNNSKDKLKIVRGKQATIQFFSRSNLDASIFSEGSDNRWLVTISIQDTGDILFKGYLVMNDHEQEFQTNPTIVTLTATDNLALLSDIPLTDFNGLNPISTDNKFKIILFLAWALSKANLNLNINVCCSFFEESYPSLCAFDNIYLDKHTFEKDINISEDCLTVIEKILKPFCCFLTQYKGAWWIQNIDEMEFAIGGSFTFNPSGILMSSQPPQQLSQRIGAGRDSVWINEDARVSFLRPYKYVQYDFNYDYPKEIIPNQDFSRSATRFISPIVVDMSLYLKTFSTKTSFPAQGSYDLIYHAADTNKFYKWNGSQYVEITGEDVPQGVAYVLEDWSAVRVDKSSGTEDSSTTFSYYIARIFQPTGYEKERYLVVTPKTEQTSHYEYLKSGAIPVGAYDKFDLSFDYRIPHISTGNFQAVLAYVSISGDDGSTWWLGNTQPNGGGQWTWNNLATSGFPQTYVAEYNTGQFDLTNWQTASIQAPRLPVSGDLFIRLSTLHQGNTFDNLDIHYQNLQFTYNPYINGSYQKYSGQYRKVSQLGTYSGNLEDQIYISDSPRKIFKGALFKPINGKYQLAGKWYSGAVFPGNSLPANDFLHPLGHLQVYTIWNQFNRSFRYFTGTVKGLKAGDNTVLTQGIVGSVPDLVELYFLDDVNINTNNKVFMATEINSDYDNDTMTVTLMETFDVTRPKVYTDVEEFKYISQ